jgi:hypothetical protein
MSTTNVSPAVEGLNAPPSDVNNGTSVFQKQPSEPIVTNEDLVSNAFELGSLLVELKSRIQVSLLEETHFPMRLVSVWRSLFNRIAILQNKAFPTCTTALTLYEPPDKTVLPYLFPEAPDYASIGIPLGKSLDGNILLENFKLYDVTRRATNCLSLLYVDPLSSLIPRQTEKNQKNLIEAILNAAKNPDGGGGSMDNTENKARLREEAELDFSIFKNATDDRMRAIVILTERLVKLLNAWDGYLRENYYSSGHLPNDETELIAYEAGRSMAILSWGLTLDTSAIDKLDSLTPEQQQKASQQAWQQAFREEFVNRLQQQISALNAFLDAGFATKSKLATLTSKDDKVAFEVDPQRPRNIINAVKTSMEYWRQTIKLITNEKDENVKARNQDWESFKKLRLALIEQTSIWQMLITGKQDLRSYNVERVTQKIMQDISSELQKRLSSDFKGNLHKAQAVVKDLTTEVTEFAKGGLNTLFQSAKQILVPACVVIGVLVLLILGATIFDWGAGGKTVGAGAGGAGLVGLITTVLGFFNLRKEKATQQENIEKKQEEVQKKSVEQPVTNPRSGDQPGDGNFFTQLKGAAHQAGDFVIDAFHRAIDQIKVELTNVKYSASVSYPLIEVFARTYDLKSDEKFITDVIFNERDRKEEISRVVGAAFGPLSAFIGFTEQEQADEATA